MRNLIIIGPPASGKLTIAKSLAGAHGYFLFDNHRSIDAAKLLTTHQSTTPPKLCHAIRKCVFEAAAGSNTPIIFTMVYGHPIDFEVMQEYIRILTTDAPPLIVQLHCAREETRKRCQDQSRVGTSKIQEPDRIDEVHSEFDLESDYQAPNQDILHINTSTSGVEESVKTISARIQEDNLPK